MPVDSQKSIARTWRKSRLAARILRRQDRGTLTTRDIRIGRLLGNDPAVTPRLLHQALRGFALRDARLELARR